MHNVKVFSLSKNTVFTGYLKRFFDGHVREYHEPTELIKSVIKHKYQAKSLFLVFLDADIFSFSDLIEIIRRLHEINPHLGYLVHLSDSSADRAHQLSEASYDKCWVFSERIGYDEFSQIVSKLFQFFLLAEQKTQLSQKLFELEKHYQDQRLLFDDLFGLIKYNAYGEIVEANQKAVHLIGRHVSRLIGSTIDSIFPSIKRQDENFGMPVLTGEERYIDAEGVQKWAMITTKEYKEDYQIMYALVLQDITEQKDATRNFQFTLYDESVRKAKSELIHNLGNTLNSMNATQIVLKRGVQTVADLAGYLKRWLEENNEGEGTNSADSCLRFVQAMDSALENTLFPQMVEPSRAMDSDLKVLMETLSETEFQTAKLTDEEVNVYNLVRALIRSTKAFCDEYGVSVRLVDANTKVLLQTSRILLHQALLNLIKNAVESMWELPQAAKLITIHTQMHDDGSMSLLVQDNGPGIQEELRTKIFQLGFTTKDLGSGYGLHSIANFMNQYGGTVTARDAEPYGTCFELKFPSYLVSSL